MVSKKITIYLPDGLPKGIREAKIDQWSGKGLCVPRSRLNSVLKGNDYPSLLDGACVYFLISESSDRGLMRVYVGEADGFRERIRNQDNTKDWWNDVVVFYSQDGSLTKTGIQYLESICVERLKKIGKCTIENGNIPKQPNIPKEDINGLEMFYDNIALIMPILGFDIFVQEESTIPVDELKLLYCKGKGVIARGILLNDGKVRVLKGSEAVLKDVESFKEHFYKGLKEELIKMERLKQENDKLIFVDDYVFDSPSAAAAIILARSASGPIEWKDKSGKTLKDLLDIK